MTKTEELLFECWLDELMQEYIEELETVDYYGMDLLLMAS